MGAPARIRAATTIGIDGVLVDVEADVAPGLPAFNLVGLPDAAVKESRDRVRAAIRNCSIAFPRTRVTVNLAPADLKKEGPAFDLPIACAVLLAAGRVEFEREDGMPGDERGVSPISTDTLLVGELGLDGSVRPVSGILPIALAARRHGIASLILPRGNAAEASVVAGVTALPASHLREVVAHLLGVEPLVPYVRDTVVPALADADHRDFRRIQGLDTAKRVFEIAAAGGHNVLLVGPPGSGKSLLAHALPSILPALVDDEQLEATVVHSVAGLLPPDGGLLPQRPFRSPHHTASDVAIVGGGANPRPGEVSLAHRGVLFLDEFPEFSRAVLESLRQPLEDGQVTVSRAAGSVTFPARFQLVAAMNPCPCGYWGDDARQCVCPPSAILKYQRRISGPLLDRIDLVIDVPRQPTEVILADAESGAASSEVREHVEAARNRQRSRAILHGIPGTNAELQTTHLKAHAPLTDDARTMLLAAANRFHLSARATIRTLRVSRTIADLSGDEVVNAEHVSEALQYRPKFLASTM